MNQTPSGMRIHIGFFGRTNSGKSSLINALTNQEVSIVSPEPGTTTDPVYKAIEIAPLGPCLLIDTAGLMDETALGSSRMARTKKAVGECDVAVMVLPASGSGSESDLAPEREWVQLFFERNVPVVVVLSHADERETGGGLEPVFGDGFSFAEGEKTLPVISVSSTDGTGIDQLRNAIIRAAECLPDRSILGGLVEKNDLVMLVMPQDSHAPKGRLILPQVSTLRELLDTHARTMCVVPEEMESALAELRHPPALIITDSQVFDYVYERTPKESRLTSFSVLYAGLKGDVSVFIRGAQAIDGLRPGARVLVAESCSHTPVGAGGSAGAGAQLPPSGGAGAESQLPPDADIGRVKIPTLIQKHIGGDISIEVVTGKDFPADLSGYDLILQCGGCMVNRRQIMSRIQAAEAQGVPITNYGIAIAYLKGILDRIEWGGTE